MSNGNNGGVGNALAMIGVLAMSASAGSAAYFLIGKEDDEPSPTPTPADVVELASNQPHQINHVDALV